MKKVFSALAMFACVSMAHARSDQPITLKKSVVNGTHIIQNWASLAKVHGLKAGGDGFLSVRSIPSSQGDERDRLGNERFVIAIERKGDFWGVVYLPDNESDVEVIAKKCGLDEHAARGMKSRSIYNGPCNWGWVHHRWIVLLSD